MSDIPTCHPGNYRGGRGIPFSKLAVGEVFHGVGGFKMRTYVKVCPEHSVAISHVPAEDVEAIRNVCAREHWFEGPTRYLERSLARFDDETRVRPTGKRLFVPDAEAEANWKEHAETVAEMMSRSMKEDGSG